MVSQMFCALVVLLFGVWNVGVQAEHCPRLCSGHGTCDITSTRCNCFDGWRGYDCRHRTCPTGRRWVGFPTDVDEVHGLEAECSNMGRCNKETGECECEQGFEGFACQYMSCPGRMEGGAVCSGHGRCVTLREAGREYNGYSLVKEFKYETAWDADMVRGCVCDLGWGGYDCSERECPKGDDPLTTGQVDEVQQLTCSCPGDTCSGSLVLEFKSHPTPLISALAVGPRSEENEFVATIGTGKDESLEAKLEAIPLLDGVIVTLNTSFTDPDGIERASLCQPNATGGGITRITFNEHGGDVPPLVVHSSVRGKFANGSDAGVAEVVLAHNGQDGTVRGTTEYATCSNRGVCDTVTGACVCYSGYTGSDGDGNIGHRGDCGATTRTITDCPNSLERCSGAGICDTQEIFNGSLVFLNTSDPLYENSSFAYTCTCHQGYRGGDCSERTCPTGLAWFDEPWTTNRAHEYAECSNRGHCLRSSGICDCEPGFEGSACERLVCPSEPGVRDELADPCSGRGRCITLRESAEEARRDGVRPGKEEIQTITCQGASFVNDTANFTVRFRHHLSRPIDAFASAATVQSVIEAMPTVGFVSVAFNPGPTACLNDSFNEMRITFSSDLGNLPQMQVFDNPVGSLNTTVTTNRDGSRISYGEDPTNAETWDADKLQFCHCDGSSDPNATTTRIGSYFEARGGIDYVGYEGTGLSTDVDVGKFNGPSCADRSCPYGVDPVGAGDVGVLEKQAIRCSLNATLIPSARIILTILEESTPPLRLSATLDEVKSALESLDTVGSLRVSLSSNNSLDSLNSTIGTLCEPESDLQANGSVVSITYLTELGPRPLIRATLTSGDASKLSTYRIREGTRRPIECSGRGTCDSVTGLCQCFTGHVSGNGARNKGNRGDCGGKDALFVRQEDKWRLTSNLPPALKPKHD